MYWNMKLTDKRFWIWWAIIALMPVFMGVFAVLVMPPAFRISHSAALDLFLVWEIACLTGGWRSYREIQDKGWMVSSLVCWTKNRYACKGNDKHYAHQLIADHI